MPIIKPKLLAKDCETTGVDGFHGAGAYFFTSCNEAGEIFYWEADVCPLTRNPQWSAGDIRDMNQVFAQYDTWVYQNQKFDRGFEELTGLKHNPKVIHDTLLAGHLLASNQPHDLTSMALQYLGIDIEPYETRMEKAVQEARRYCRSKLPDWRIAKEGLEDMPSYKSSSNPKKDPNWKFDCWLLRALRKAGHFEDREEWDTLLSDYANTDSSVTLALWKEMEKHIRGRGLWEIYAERLKLLPVAYEMEQRDLTLIDANIKELIELYTGDREAARNRCVSIAASYNYELTLPKSGRNNSLNEFVFDVLKLEKLYAPKAKTANPTLDSKIAIPHYLATLPHASKQRAFIKSLVAERKRGTYLTYIEGYKRFCLPTKFEGYLALHPNANVTGSDTLRWTMSNPNGQNVCVDPSTEILTKRGWVLAPNLRDSDLIAQYWKQTEEINFTKAVLRKHRFSGNMIHITTEQQIDMLLTPDHRCLLEHRKTGEKFDVKASDFKADHLHCQAGNYVGGDTKLSQAEVVWLCAVQADGSYQKTDGEEYGIKVGLKKARKYLRLEKALNELEAEYSLRREANGTRVFYIGKNQHIVRWVKEILPNKKFTARLLDFDRETLDEIADELFLWDGDSTRRASYSSSDKQNSDWVQILYTLSNSRANLVSRMPKNSWAKRVHHYVNVALGRTKSITSNFVKEEIPWDGAVYCVTVPSSYIIIRRNGRVAVTGNSKQGMTCEVCNGEGCDDCDYKGSDPRSLRYLFGPLPGREWWALDYENLELRIPAYESGEKPMIELFERPNEAPYFGSYHLLNASIIYPDLFWPIADIKGEFKRRYASTWYQWDKNFGFALQYQCGEATGDRAAHKVGAWRAVKTGLPNMEALNQKMVKFADRHGYVETIPDKTVNPGHGYPVMCSRSEWGRISPTIPLSYHVQSTAMWCTGKAMVRTSEKLKEWRKQGFDAQIALQVHDEIIFDLPVVDGGNLERVKELKRLMEKSGEDIGIPLTVSYSHHPDNWAEGH